MKISMLVKSVAVVVFAVMMLVQNLCAQSLEFQGQTASEILEGIIANKDHTPLALYPPGHLEWLQAIGDDVLPSYRSLSSGSLQRGGGMMMQMMSSPPPPMYQVIDLGAFDGNDSVAYGINEKGEVAGYSTTNGSTRAFIYANGFMKSLGTLGGASVAYAINENSQVVGVSGSHAFLSSGSTMQDLGTLGGSESIAYGINDLGQIVGDSLISGNIYRRAFLSQNGAMQSLGTLGGNQSSARAINNSGRIVGNSLVVGNYSHAFMHANGLMHDIGTLGGLISSANGVNDLGQVVGRSFLSDNVQESMFIFEDDSMEDLGHLNGVISVASSINSSGYVVGGGYASYPSYDFRACLYANSTLYLLGNLVTNASTWIFSNATAINDRGQIVGVGINPSGKTRAFLLNPIPAGVAEAVSQTPTQKVYVAVSPKTKQNLVVVTHGWNAGTASWVDVMTNSIRTNLIARGLTNWQVMGYKWLEDANTGFNPDKALNTGKQHGLKLGTNLANQNWAHVHFIGHSAGAGLIDEATKLLKSTTQTTVHSTFLDPYVGTGYEGVENYGKTADWSDSYYSKDLITLGSISSYTDEGLHFVYEVNVTHLDPSKLSGIKKFGSVAGTVFQPCEEVMSSHDWPHDFYLNTITGNTNSQYLGFGFPLGKEGGNWTYATNTYHKGGTKKLGNVDSDCLPAGSFAIQALNRVVTSELPLIEVGTITRFINAFYAATHSPSYMALPIYTTNTVNLVSFDAKFTSITNGAKGLLTVYWDTNVIGSLDETAVLGGYQHYTYRFPRSGGNSTHVLSFRIDPFTNVQSSIIVTNIVLGIAGPSIEPSLKKTTNTVNSLRVWELTGESGFTYTVETSTNLINWSTIALLANTNGTVRFYDPTSSNAVKRFYRASASQ